ncbi:MAG: ribonuclease P protein component [Clostridia bacterium]|nr:ribonuclease P protein component [Clostridia bacterium]
MQKYLTLKENTDFNRVYYRGKSSAKPALVVYALKNRVGICRVGITTSKKTGNAVERNRSRRIIRAACQSVFRNYEISGNYDFVFVSRSKTKYLKSTQVEKAMIECMKAVGVIK